MKKFILFFSAIFVLSACTVQIGGDKGGSRADVDELFETYGEEVSEDLAVASVTAYTFWESWDADAEKDGAEVSFYFEDATGGYLYPTVQDWEVDVTLFNSEYDDNFDLVKTDVVFEGTFEADEVLYDSLGDPFVRIDREDITGQTDTYGWAEVTIKSPTYGEFGAIDEYAQIDD